MTHKELLAKFDNWGQESQYAQPWKKALRAVVELHKPISCGCGRWDCEAKLCGSICGKVGIYYPCPTIQAIEKELN